MQKSCALKFKAALGIRACEGAETLHRRVPKNTPLDLKVQNTAQMLISLDDLSHFESETIPYTQPSIIRQPY